MYQSIMKEEIEKDKSEEEIDPVNTLSEDGTLVFVDPESIKKEEEE